MIHNLNATDVNFVMDKNNYSFPYLIKVTGITAGPITARLKNILNEDCRKSNFSTWLYAGTCSVCLNSNFRIT